MKRTTAYKVTYLKVLKRDKYTCQSCGKTPPEIILECIAKEWLSQDRLKDANYFTLSCNDCMGEFHREGLNAYLTPTLQEQLDLMSQDKNIPYDHTGIALAKNWSVIVGEAFSYERYKVLKTLIEEHSLDAVRLALQISTKFKLRRRLRNVTKESTKKAWDNIPFLAKTFNEMQFSNFDEIEKKAQFSVASDLNRIGLDWANLPFDYPKKAKC